MVGVCEPSGAGRLSYRRRDQSGSRTSKVGRFCQSQEIFRRQHKSSVGKQYRSDAGDLSTSPARRRSRDYAIGPQLRQSGCQFSLCSVASVPPLLGHMHGGRTRIRGNWFCVRVSSACGTAHGFRLADRRCCEGTRSRSRWAIARGTRATGRGRQGGFLGSHDHAFEFGLATLVRRFRSPTGRVARANAGFFCGAVPGRGTARSRGSLSDWTSPINDFC
jgi:hypothetical protein